MAINTKTFNYASYIQASEPRSEVEEFLQKYNAVAEIDQYQRYEEYPSFQYSYQNGFASQYLNRVPVHVYNVKITEPQLRRLIQTDLNEDRAVRYANECGNALDRLRREETLRNSNPALQKAYEKYQMLLKLTYGEKL